jgi:hypothetical protein
LPVHKREVVWIHQRFASVRKSSGGITYAFPESPLEFIVGAHRHLPSVRCKCAIQPSREPESDCSVARFDQTKRPPRQQDGLFFKGE